jgi:hypothetical protein
VRPLCCGLQRLRESLPSGGAAGVKSSLSWVAGLVIVGDEILSGKVEDSNITFLCTKLYEIGWTVRKVCCLLGPWYDRGVGNTWHCVCGLHKGFAAPCLLLRSLQDCQSPTCDPRLSGALCCVLPAVAPGVHSAR